MLLFWLEVLSYLLVLDSAAAVWIAWYGQRWYLEHVGLLARYLPPAKGWALWYAALAVFIFWLINIGLS